MKKTYISCALLFLLGTWACNEDFTDNPPEKVETTDTFFLEEDNVEASIIGIYDLMFYNYSRDWHSAFLVKLIPGDDANAAGGNPEDQPQLQEIDQYSNVSTSNSSIGSIWNLFYRTIALSNLVTENLKESTLSNKTRADAEAKFFRAWCYFELTTMFGDLPLRLTLPSSPDDFPLGKSPQADIYEQIESDLTDAIAGLPDKTAVSDIFRVSKGAAEALMGKVLVFQEKYNDAIPFFESVIANPAHDLEQNINDVWLESGEFGIESLVEIGFLKTTGRDWGNIVWGGRNDSNLHIQLMGPREGIFVFNTDEAKEIGVLPDLGIVSGWGFNTPTTKLVNAFDTASDTKRKAATVMTEDEILAAGGEINAPAGGIWGYEGAIRTKYVTRSQETDQNANTPLLNYGTNFRLFRYAEVLLLAAEAYNKVGGKDDMARAELNKIRERAGLDDVPTSLAGDALFDAIVEEKFLELAHEGQRFWDLVRWGRASTELAGTGYSSKNNLFPIPKTEIDKNGALTEADQNPGY